MESWDFCECRSWKLEKKTTWKLEIKSWNLNSVAVLALLCCSLSVLTQRKNTCLLHIHLMLKAATSLAITPSDAGGTHYASIFSGGVRRQSLNCHQMTKTLHVAFFSLKLLRIRRVSRKVSWVQLLFVRVEIGPTSGMATTCFIAMPSWSAALVQTRPQRCSGQTLSPVSQSNSEVAPPIKLFCNS